MRWGWGVTLAVVSAGTGRWYFSQSLCLAIQVSDSGGRGGGSHWFTWALGAISVEAFLTLRLPAWSRNIWLENVVVLAALMTLSIPSLHNLAAHDFAWLFLHPVWGVAFFIVLNRAFLPSRVGCFSFEDHS